MVVGPEDECQVFQAHDHDERPKHQREDSQHIGVTYRDAVITMETLPNGINRAGADIPKNNAQGGQRKLRQTFLFPGLRPPSLFGFSGIAFSVSAVGMVICVTPADVLQNLYKIPCNPHPEGISTPP
jgi:hypothetical protein